MPVETEIQAPASIRAPRGNSITCKGWQQEAAMRMLMNNLDEEVAERPKDLVVYGGTGRAARSWEAYRAIVATLKNSGQRRDVAGAVGQAGRRFQDARSRAARADRQFESRRPLVELGEVQRTRTRRPHDVRPDDRRFVDLHRLARHRAGHVRNIFRRGRKAFRRRSRRQADRLAAAWAAWAELSPSLRP